MSEELIGGRYQLERRLGLGGMATVYRALDTRLRRPVALKLLSAAQHGQYLAREAQAVASLQHPNIVQLFDYSGPDEDPPYLVMELVEGLDAQRVLATMSPLPAEALLVLARDVAAGRPHAHERGIVHRDIKPGNVMLASSGRVVLMDFGIAKSLRAPAATGGSAGPSANAARMTRLIGTIDFMAPEQLQEQVAGPYSDVFSLGSLLCALATGRAPFTQDTAVDTMAAIVRGRRAPLADERPDLPAPLRGLLEACLAGDPVDRPDAAEVSERAATLLRQAGIADAQRFLRDLQRGATTTVRIPRLPAPG